MQRREGSERAAATTVTTTIAGVRRRRTWATWAAVLALSMVIALPADAKRKKKRKRSYSQIRDIPVITLPVTFSQKDKRWSRDRVGGSNESLRKVGCVVTSVAMTFNYFGVPLDPKTLNAELRKVRGGYNRRGWLSWFHAARISDGKVKLIYNGRFNETKLDAMLLMRIPVIVKTRSVRNSIHWMVVVGKRKGQYLVHDPLHLHGKVVPFKKVAKKIYQMRVYDLQLKPQMGTSATPEPSKAAGQANDTVNAKAPVPTVVSSPALSPKKAGAKTDTAPERR